MTSAPEVKQTRRSDEALVTDPQVLGRLLWLRVAGGGSLAQQANQTCDREAQHDILEVESGMKRCISTFGNIVLHQMRAPAIW